jgi:AraC family transcriptional regulator, transcriptional activator of pobA
MEKKINRIDLSYFKDIKNVKMYDNHIACGAFNSSEDTLSRDYVYCNYCSISVIQNGELIIDVNQKEYTLHRKDIIFLGSTDLIKVKSTSKGCKFITLFIDLYFMNTILSYNVVFITMWFKQKKVTEPYVTLNNTQFKIFSSLITYIMNNIDVERNNKQLWIINKIAAILLETSNIDYLKDGNSDNENDRASFIFQSFFTLLAANYKTQREIGFYADKLNISPSYLSKIVKDMSSFTVQGQINRLLLIDAYHLLSHTNMSIQQITFELNFSDQSAFTKFFKRHTNQTPMSYRKEQKKI